MDPLQKLMPFAKLLPFEDNTKLAMNLLFITIIILSIIAYKLGFSVKLPLLKSAIIYVFLILGSTLLTFMAPFYPIVEGLVVIIAVLGIYKIRLRKEKREGRI